jgi:hypothetical protein
MCTNRPVTSCRLAGTMRVSTNDRSASSKRPGMAPTCWTSDSPEVNDDDDDDVFGLIGT